MGLVPNVGKQRTLRSEARRLIGLVVWGLLLTALLGGCATARWKWAETRPGYVPPSQLFLVVKLGPEFDAGTDDGGGIASLVDALTAELGQRGIQATFAEPEDRKAYPRLTLVIRSSDAGNRVLSHFVPAGNPSISVFCSVTQARGGPPGFRGQIEGTLMGGSTTDSNTGAEAAGRAIGQAVANSEG